MHNPGKPEHLDNQDTLIIRTLLVGPKVSLLHRFHRGVGNKLKLSKDDCPYFIFQEKFQFKYLRKIQ